MSFSYFWVTARDSFAQQDSAGTHSTFRCNEMFANCLLLAQVGNNKTHSDLAKNTFFNNRIVTCESFFLSEKSLEWQLTQLWHSNDLESSHKYLYLVSPRLHDIHISFSYLYRHSRLYT